MKPRRAGAPLTHEDTDIWARCVLRASCWPKLRTSIVCAAFASDRRDADLMFRAMNWRWIPGIGIRPESVAHWSAVGLPLQRIDCGGDLSADWYHE